MIDFERRAAVTRCPDPSIGRSQLRVQLAEFGSVADGPFGFSFSLPTIETLRVTCLRNGESQNEQCRNQVFCHARPLNLS